MAAVQERVVVAAEVINGAVRGVDVRQSLNVTHEAGLTALETIVGAMRGFDARPNLTNPCVTLTSRLTGLFMLGGP